MKNPIHLYGSRFAAAAPLLLSISCIGPTGKPGQPGTTAAGPSGTETGVASPEFLAEHDIHPVKPMGDLLFDGTSMVIMNIEPPGSWYVFNDSSPDGKMTPESTSDIAGMLDNGLRTTGEGYKEWGGGIGFNVVGSQLLTPVDASAYRGIRFTASGRGWLHFALATVVTMPEFNLCTKCYDHYAADIRLTEKPQEYTFTWSELRQAGWGAPKAKLDTNTIIGFNFTSKGPATWDFTIDDVGFLK